MKAFILNRYKKKQPLRLGEMPEQGVGDRDVLVAIAAAGLNPLDAKIRDVVLKPLLKYRPPLRAGA